MDCNKKLTKNEFDFIFKKLEDYYKTQGFVSGQFETVCPRCGHKLVFDMVGNSCSAICETDKCIVFCLRGI